MDAVRRTGRFSLSVRPAHTRTVSNQRPPVFPLLESTYLGIICMAPWNTLITIDGYWDYKFRDQSLDSAGSGELDPDDQELTK